MGKRLLVHNWEGEHRATLLVDIFPVSNKRNWRIPQKNLSSFWQPRKSVKKPWDGGSIPPGFCSKYILKLATTATILMCTNFFLHFPWSPSWQTKWRFCTYDFKKCTEFTTLILLHMTCPLKHRQTHRHRHRHTHTHALYYNYSQLNAPLISYHLFFLP